MSKRVVVVGAGLSGLAAAIRLADAGYHVIILDKNSAAGGKLSQHHAHGFHFDLGPSLLTLPAVITDLLGEYNNEFQLLPVDPICTYCWTDGTVVHSTTHATRFDDELHRMLGEKRGRYLRFAAATRRIYENIAPLFLTNSLQHRSLLTAPLFWQSILKIPLGLACTPLSKYIAHFFRNHRTHQIFARFATYNGSSPYRQSAIYSLISHVEHHGGGYIPQHGMAHIVSLLMKRATHCGVSCYFNEEVTTLHTCRNKMRHYIEAVESNRGRYPCDLLIMAGDVYQNAHLFGRTVSTRKQSQLSTSAIIFLWGVADLHPQLSLHNILFSNDYYEEFEDIFSRGMAPTDPTIYINITSKYIPTTAPQHCENWFVMINVPAHPNIDWGLVSQDIRWKVLQKINAFLHHDLEKKIVYEKIITPHELATISHCYNGALYGSQSHGMFSALSRPANFDHKYANCFYAGGTVHPGGGIPLALLSGQIAATLAAPHDISFPTL